ncbi:hypothetical protein MTO96_001504 [Rhipicephalus appendiculatus]
MRRRRRFVGPNRRSLLLLLLTLVLIPAFSPDQTRTYGEKPESKVCSAAASDWDDGAELRAHVCDRPPPSRSTALRFNG